MAEIWDWHNHHEVICEPRIGPIEERLDYIRKHKPQSERETRLRLIAPVTVELPAAYVKAGVAYVKAGAAYVKAGVAYSTARAAYVTALAAYDKAWVAYDKAWVAFVKAQADFNKALADFNKAWAAYDTAGVAYDKALAAYVKALADAAPELERLHALDCPAALAGTCPWDGTTIFPGGNR